ncbi:MAG: hypothetical protein M3N53_08450 [Actinomycetota bacterium]|nr:hypothetical protein [Actinomycetota bacterium]
MIELALAIDKVVESRCLIYGSIPPHARDLDLLVREHDERALSEALSGWGFTRKAQMWVRFGVDSVDAVDLTPAATWGLPADELEALFGDAVAIEGMHHLVRPSPHHALLILARRLVRAGILDDKRRARLDSIVAEDPDALNRARVHASAWGASRALGLLDAGRHAPSRLLRTARVAALAEQLRASGVSSARSWPEASAALTPRVRPPRVVAFSGLDGSGKSTQVRLLAATLEHLGFRVAIAWHRVTFNPSLDLIARPVKALLALVRRATRSRAPLAQAPGPSGEPPARVFERGRVVSSIWGILVAIANGSSHRRTVLKHTRRADIVLCDRYVLDSWVQIRWLYGGGPLFPLQRVAVRALSPRPVVALFLRVPPQVAWARKRDEFSPTGLEIQAVEYDRLFRSARAVVLDATRPAEEVAREVARTVWLAT